MLKFIGYFIYLLFLFQSSIVTAKDTTLDDNKSLKFNVIESTISQVHTALTNKKTNCVSIVESFRRRIQTYDQSTKLNSIILLNPNALKRAKKLDDQFLKTKKLLSLHCIPVILKDNFDTADMPTEAGAFALKGSIPPDDAFMVKRLREAGAIILAKSNMGEFAFSPYSTISSTHGETLNAYDLRRVPAGSSGGTASAIAANFGIIGMGTDTGNSIRGPASHLALVGMRSTIGLTSRDGIVPLVLNRDIAGPLTRSVEDAARTFNVIAGYDEADPITHNKQSRKKVDYTQFLKEGGLKGARLGVLRSQFNTKKTDPEIIKLMGQAIKDLTKAGAIIIEPFEIENLAALSHATGFCSRFRYDLNNYLLTLGDKAPIKKFHEIYDKMLFLEKSAGAIKWANAKKVPPQDQKIPCVDVAGDIRRTNLLNAVVKAMDKYKVDAIIYPTWSNPPATVNNTNGPYGNNSQLLAPHTGQPAITVPMGYTVNGTLPAGLQFLARSFDDAKLFQYAYAYEQCTHHRKPPALFP